MNKMRWFFWTLLMLNAVAAYWFSSEADHRRDVASNLASVKIAAQGAGVPELQLWHERPALTEQKEIKEATIGQQASMPSLADSEQDASDRLLKEEVCHQLGPFEPGMVAKIQLALGDHANEISVLNKEDVVNEGFWLIMAPRETRAEAELLLKTLHDKDIESFLITDGEYQNGITLGVFTEKENTESYQEKLMAEGVESVLIPRVKTRKTSWLQLKGDNDYEKTLAALTAVLSVEEAVFRQEEKASCEISN